MKTREEYIKGIEDTVAFLQHFKTEKDYFCPYCGDELASEEEVKEQENHFALNGKCSHWDDENKFKIF
jgi:transcription elongation factor Elf1